MSIIIKRKEAPIESVAVEGYGWWVGFGIVGQRNGTLQLHIRQHKTEEGALEVSYGGSNSVSPGEARELAHALLEMADQIKEK